MVSLGEIKEAVGCPGELNISDVAVPLTMTVVISKLRRLLPLSYRLTLHQTPPGGTETLIGQAQGRVGGAIGLFGKDAAETTITLVGNFMPTPAGTHKIKLVLWGSILGLFNVKEDEAECTITVPGGVSV